jgi:hypothetical protein
MLQNTQKKTRHWFTRLVCEYYKTVIYDTLIIKSLRMNRNELFQLAG